MDSFRDNTIFASKALDDRLNIIECSSGHSLLETPINKIQNALISDKESIGIEYLLNYQTIRLADAINISMYVGELFQYMNATEPLSEISNTNTITLGKGHTDSFSDMLTRRRSIRKYKKSLLEKEKLEQVLHDTFNVRRNGDGIYQRNIPSGGGLFPIKLFLSIQRVKGIDDGLYQYQPNSETIQSIGSYEESSVNQIFSNQVNIEIENANVIFFFVFDYMINYQKYGDLALALGFIEVGIISQALNTVATHCRLGACHIGGFDKPKAEKYINVDGIYQHCVYAMTMGMEG